MDLTDSNFPSEKTGIDEKSNHADTQKRSVKSYATRVFQESTIGMVSSIVTTHSKYRKVFKTLVFLICISGFLYQCITFLEHVFEYPTTVDVQIRTLDSFNIPAYTFCTNNAMKRSLFCNMYPNRCYKPSEEFCKKFRSYCGTNDILIPKKEYYELEKSMSHEEILIYGDDLNDFYEINRSTTKNKEYPSGPYLRVKRDLNAGAMLCYSLHSVVENNAQPIQTRKETKFDNEPVDILTFYIDESQMIKPGNGPGVLFSIHSPYEAVNPFDKGIFMKPGITYIIFVEMEQAVLLKQPYETNCENYQELWEKSNHTGPRIQEMCQHKCLLDLSVQEFGCVDPFILYPTEERFCDIKDIYNVSIPLEKWIEAKKCWENCRDDCRVTTYTPEVFERHETNYNDEDTLEDLNRYITVEVYLKDAEIVTLKHSPKYMTVEIFSNIGGFMGCWLGIALMDIVDVLSSVFTVFRYAFRKECRKL